MKNIFLFAVCLMGLSACQKSDSGSSAGDSGKKQVTGSVYSAVSEVYSIPEEQGAYSPCDLEQKQMRLEIAQAIDSRSVEILELRKKSSSTSGSWVVTKTQAGEILIEESNRPKEESQGWETDIYGWQHVENLYHEVKNQPVNAKWLQLDSLIRSIALDDKYRIIHWTNYQIGPNEVSKVQALNKIVAACLEDSNCLSLTVPEELKTFVSENYYYSLHMDRLEKATRAGPTEFRDRIKDFHDRTSSDEMDRANPTFAFKHQTDAATKTIFVRFTDSIFQGHHDLFNKYTQDVWSQFGLRVQILWDQAQSVFDHFSFLKVSAGQRASVNFRKKLMKLPEITRAATISHEFGHVLGLGDEYYTVWASSKCQYTDYYDLGNIMSESGTGKVLPKHIEDLKKTYFP